ncbi:hypothetical protein C6N75_24290, partial [Streptomyces solincola]
MSGSRSTPTGAGGRRRVRRGLTGTAAAVTAMAALTASQAPGLPAFAAAPAPAQTAAAVGGGPLRTAGRTAAGLPAAGPPAHRRAPVPPAPPAPPRARPRPTL